MRKHLAISDVASGAGDRDLLFNQFLDDFLHECRPGMRALISGEPSPTGDESFDAKLAATAELLAHRHGVEVPEWVAKPRFFLDSPVYGAPMLCARDDIARDWFERNTTEEFAKRKLFLGPDLLSRR